MRPLTLKHRQVLTNLLLYGELPREQYQNLWTLVYHEYVRDDGVRLFLTEKGVNEAREILDTQLKGIGWE